MIRTITHNACLALLVCFSALQLSAQTIRTIGPGADFSTLRAAFNAVNTGSITGSIVLQVIGNTLETSSAVLNASGTGSANYSDIIVYPTVAGARISGQLAGVLVDFSGAANVTIDGRLNLTGVTRELIIENTEPSNSNARTLRFINSAENIVIRYCDIMGGCTSASAGIILFSTAGSGTGNHHITISDCLITNSLGNRPVNALYSSGSSTGLNRNILIANNYFENFFKTTASCNGINLAAHSVDWTIDGNHFYETTLFKPAGAYGYIPIKVYVTNTNRFIIRNNFIGGSAPGCAGSPWQIQAGVKHNFKGIYIRNANQDNTLITGNRISNFDIKTTEANPWQGITIYSGSAEITGNLIGAESGSGNITLQLTTAYLLASVSGSSVDQVIIAGGGQYDAPPQITFHGGGGNGAAAVANLDQNGAIVSVNVTNGGTGYTSTPTIRLESQSTNFSTVHGIWVNSAGAVSISGNTIGSFSLWGSDYYSCGFEGIQCTNSQTGLLTIVNNTIGNLLDTLGIVCESQAIGAAAGQRLYGIFSQAVTNTTIQGNIIAGFTNRYSGTNTGSITTGIFVNRGTNTIINNLVTHIRTYTGNTTGYSTASIIGIAAAATQSLQVQKVIGNEVSFLTNMHPTARVDLYGIFLNGPTNTWHEVSGNYLHHYSLNTSENNSFVDALVLYTGKTNCFNNVVVLTHTYYDAPNAKTYNQVGIWHHASTSSDLNLHFNTVVLQGSINPASPTNSSYAFWNNANSTTRKITGNIFCNLLQGGHTGKHYAIRLAGNSNVTINHNNYLTASGNPLGRFNTTDYTTLNSWASATGQDVLSLNTDPVFANTALSGSMQYIPTVNLPAQYLSQITTDYHETPRTAIPTMGAFEQLYLWSGQLNTDWGTAGNWTGLQVPAEGKSVLIPASRPNYPVLDQGRNTGMLVIDTGASLTIPSHSHLTVLGSLENYQGINGLLITSGPNGPGSLIQHTVGVEASVSTYLPGDAHSWHMISAPVSNMSISGSPFEPGGTDDLYLWHEPSPGIWVNYKNQDGSGGNPSFPDANQNGNQFITGRGYLVAYHDVNPVKEYSGVLHSGEISIPLQFSGSKSWIWEAGWNLIGNPYPSSIDWNLVNKEHLAEIHAQVYDPAFGNGGGYRQVNIIAPGQGFFVKAAHGNGSIALNSTVQTHGASMLKTADQLFADKLKLRISQNGLFDEAQLIVTSDASTDYDFFDATKLFSYNPETPQLFFRLANERWLSVNALPGIPNQKTIPLSYTASDHEFTVISIEDLTGSLAKTHIYLHDRLLDTIVHLSQTKAYGFDATPGEHHDRFELLFVIPALTGESYVEAYTFENKLVVQNLLPKATLGVFTTDGKQLIEMTLEPGIHQIPTSLTKGIYVVLITAPEETYSAKLFFSGI